MEGTYAAQTRQSYWKKYGAGKAGGSRRGG